jgi:hypothetical protein
MLSGNYWLPEYHVLEAQTAAARSCRNGSSQTHRHYRHAAKRRTVLELSRSRCYIFGPLPNVRRPGFARGIAGARVVEAKNVKPFFCE